MCITTQVTHVPDVTKSRSSRSCWWGKHGRERRLNVALRHDFLRVQGLTRVAAAASSPASEGMAVGDGTSLCGDLGGGAALGLVDEHLLGACLTDFTWTSRYRSTMKIHAAGHKREVYETGSLCRNKLPDRAPRVYHQR